MTPKRARNEKGQFVSLRGSQEPGSSKAFRQVILVGTDSDESSTDLHPKSHQYSSSSSFYSDDLPRPPSTAKSAGIQSREPKTRTACYAGKESCKIVGKPAGSQGKRHVPKTQKASAKPGRKGDPSKASKVSKKGKEPVSLVSESTDDKSSEYSYGFLDDLDEKFREAEKMMTSHELIRPALDWLYQEVLDIKLRPKKSGSLSQSKRR